MNGSANFEIGGFGEREGPEVLVEAVTSPSLSRSCHSVGDALVFGTMYQGTSPLRCIKSLPEAKLAGSLSFVMRKYICPAVPSEGWVFLVSVKRSGGR